MNKYEKAIAELTDETLNRILKDTAAEKDRCKFQIQVNEVTGMSDTTPYRRMYALMDILSNFANRELKERGKKKK
jgi:hypothetical protein